MSNKKECPYTNWQTPGQIA